MSIKRINSTSYDIFGGGKPYYKAKAGDYTRTDIVFSESIYTISSSQNPITCTNVQRVANILQFSSYKEINGFAINQNITAKKTLSGGTTSTFTATIVNINYATFEIEFSNLFGTPSFNLPLWDSINILEVWSDDMRGNLFFNLNLVQSSLTTQFDTIASNFQSSYSNAVENYRKSTIDGTNVRFGYDTSGMIVTDVATMVQEGFKSGDFGTIVTIERTTDINSYTRQWIISFTNNQLGLLFPDGFNTQSSNKLLLYFDLEWYSIMDDLVEPTVVQWCMNNTQTAWFNNAVPNETPNSVYSLPWTNALYYDQEVTNTIEFTSASPNITMGAMFVPSDDNYFKVKNDTQGTLCMLINIPIPLIVGTFGSNINPNGAQYEIEITALSYVAGVHSVTFKFRSSNQAFIDLMESLSEFDRQMYIWFQVGNVNHLIWDFALGKNPKPVNDWTDITPPNTIAGNPTFIGTDSFVFATDKSQYNYPEPTGAKVSIEDNLYLQIYAFLFNNQKWLSSKFEIIVVNSSDDTDFFVLEQINFNWALAPVLNDGNVDIHAITSISENLQATAHTIFFDFLNYKVEYIGKTFANVTSVTKFGVKFNCPIILNWRYWIAQANAFVNFYPNQNKNWINYNDLGYKIAIRTTVESDTNIYQRDSIIEEFRDYGETFTNANEEWVGTIGIEYFDSSGNQVPNLINNDLITVKVTVNSNLVATTNNFFGMLTIEPKENFPRWTISSNYNHDNNINNPFEPILGQVKLHRTLVTASQVTYEAVIDCNKLNSVNYKITAKHYLKATKVEQVRQYWNVKNLTKQAFNGIEIDDDADCCDVTEKVFASLTENEPYKNDITTKHFLLYAGGSVVFELYKDDVLATYQPPTHTFPNQIEAKYCNFPWKSVLDNDDVGCFTLKAVYTDVYANETIIILGLYQLENYSKEAVAGLVNIRAYFNSNQVIDGINYTDANLLDCTNVAGFFGRRDPKTEVDNETDFNRITRKIRRENLNEYSFISNPISFLFTKRLFDLYFLSENNLYFTDNNAFNHEKFVMKNVIFQENSTPEPIDDYSKYVVLTSKFGDKTKDKLSNFG